MTVHGHCIGGEWLAGGDAMADIHPSDTRDVERVRGVEPWPERAGPVCRGVPSTVKAACVQP